MRKIFILFIIALIMMCETSHAKTITSFSQLNDPAITIGTDGASPLHYAALKEFPDAQYSYFWEISDGFLALRTGKIDAYVLTEFETKAALKNGLQGIRILPGYLGEPVPIAAGISRKSKIKDLKEKFNAFLAENKANGTIDGILRRWIDEGDMRIPDDVKAKVPKKSDIRLKVGTTGSVMPFSYFIGSEISGIDIEIAYRFAAYLGAELEFVVYNFSSALIVGSSENVDMAMSNLFATPEREETTNFSDTIYYENTVVMVYDDASLPVPVKAANNDVKSFDGKRIALATGTIHDELVREVLPSAEILLFENFADCAGAVLTGKADAIADDEEILRPVIKENDNFAFVDGYVKSFEYAPIFAKTERGDKLRMEFNEYIKRINSDGTMQQMKDIWLNDDESKKILPDYENFPDTNGIVRIAVSNESPPFDYMSNGKLAGLEIDMILRFCKERGYKPEFMIGRFSSVIPSVASNKCDIGMSILTITPERAENVNFSDPTYTGGTRLLVLKTPENAHGKYKSIAEFNGQPIGVQTGNDEWSRIVRELMPQSEIVYYNTFADLMQALLTQKIEAFLADEPVYELMAAESKQITALDEKLDESFDVAFTFPKNESGKKLCGEVSEYIRSIKANGELDKIIAKWTGADESKKTLPDYGNFKAEKGVLTMATEGEYPPFNYIRDDNELAGFEIEIAARFCEANGYGLKITPMAFDSILPAIVSGKFDFAGASLAPEDEHSESVIFSEPYYQSRSVLVVMKHDEAVPEQPEIRPSKFAAFIEDIKGSLIRTFIREDRWQLFIEGIVNTMIITILAIIFGTILGFVIYLLCRSGNIFANLLTDFAIWLVKGTPIVVLLMILYYVVFGSVNINGIWVAVIAFTMTFGSSFCIMLRFGTGAVDKGQTEAAYALGFTDWQTFFTVILPQAALHFMSTYKVEVTNLIKSTSIVGYIAVQDLTKMGDIVRSRTYEAFFPLIAVAAIYFVLSGILNFIVRIIHNRITPSKRKPENILHGIKLTGGENHD